MINDPTPIGICHDFMIVGTVILTMLMSSAPIRDARAP